jgi:predicted permease
MFLHWRSLFWRKRFESDLAGEFTFHLEARTAHLVRSGLTPEEAARRARLEFGAFARYREECREAHRVHWFDEARRNVQWSLRGLRKSPAFSVAAILSLALGIGVNTFVFSVIDSVLLRPLPIDRPEQVAFVETGSRPSQSFPNYREFRDSNQTFEGLAGYRIAPISLEHSGTPSRVWSYLATGNYFDLLGVKPLIGRFFHQQDDLQRGASPYAVLSYNAWQSRFGSDPNVVGSTVRINGLSYTILGVAPRGFHGTEMFYWPEVWVPMMMQPQIEVGNDWLDNRYTWDTWIVGRLKPGVPAARAAADLNRIAADLAQRYPNVDGGLHIQLAPPGLVGSSMRGPVQAFTTGVLLLAALVLLTACSNLAGLTLARATDRQREVAIRFSVGAGRARIVCQLLTESVVLALIGGAAGCVLAAFLSKLVSQWHAPVDFPVQFDIYADWRVFAFALAVSLLTGLLFGLAPALHSSRADLTGLLKGGTGLSVLKTRHRFALRDFLVAAEVAFCFVLVFGCVLSLRGLQRALTLPLGFQPDNVATVAFDLGLAGYDPAQGREFQQRAVDSLQSLPGVVSAAYANSVPLSIDQSSTTVESVDRPPSTRGRDQASATWYDASPGVLRTLGIPLLSGRDFDDHDNEHAPPVAIVNQAFVQQIMQVPEPIGKTFRYGPKTDPIRIVGVVADGKYVSLTEAPRPALFRPILQQYNSTTTIVVRSQLPASALVEQLRKQIAALDPRLPVYGAGGLTDMLGFALFPMHAAAIALSAFGLLALILAVTGIHGLVAYAVARRTRELGIRIALGARSSQVLRLVLGKLAWLVLAGIVVGLGLSLAAGRALSSIIYGTSTGDPVLLAMVLGLVLLAAAASSWRPALRALRTEPTTALRYE